MKMTKEVEEIFDIIGYHISSCTEMLDRYKTKRSVALDTLADFPLDASSASYSRAKEDYNTYCSMLDSYNDQLYALESLKRAIERECGIYEPVPDSDESEVDSND